MTIDYNKSITYCLEDIMELFPVPRVLQCARYVNSPSRRDERLVKDYEFDLYLGGEREVWVDGKHYRLSEGYMYFKRPCEVVAGIGDYNMYMITLDFAESSTLSPSSYYRNRDGEPQQVCELDKLCELPSVFFAYHYKDIIELYEKIILCTYPSAQDSELERAYIEELLFLIFADAARFRREATDIRPTTSAEHVKRACAFINRHYAEDITVDMIAQHARLNKNYLIRLFKTELGTTPMKYLLDTRLFFARALLLQTDEAVSGIAERCGFNTASYFIKCFKERFGSSPLSYKRARLEKRSQQM